MIIPMVVMQINDHTYGRDDDHTYGRDDDHTYGGDGDQ